MSWETAFPILLTPQEAAKLLKVSLSWLAKTRMHGDGPPFMNVGRSIRYTETVLLHWIKSQHLREPDLHVFAKVFEDCLKRSFEAKAFSGREIGGDDDVLDFLVGHFVDVDLTRQPAS